MKNRNRAFLYWLALLAVGFLAQLAANWLDHAAILGAVRENVSMVLGGVSMVAFIVAIFVLFPPSSLGVKRENDFSNVELGEPRTSTSFRTSFSVIAFLPFGGTSDGFFCRKENAGWVEGRPDPSSLIEE